MQEYFRAPKSTMLFLLNFVTRLFFPLVLPPQAAMMLNSCHCFWQTLWEEGFSHWMNSKSHQTMTIPANSAFPGSCQPGQMVTMPWKWEGIWGASHPVWPLWWLLGSWFSRLNVARKRGIEIRKFKMTESSLFVPRCCYFSWIITPWIVTSLHF